MIALSIGATAVAHGVHYAVLGVGLLGLLVLLGPQLVGSRGEPPVDDEHALRVHALSQHIAAGSLGVRVLPAETAAWAPRRTLDPVRARFLPLAVVSSAAAAGVHAAVGPAHFGEQVLFGLFFVGSALAQIGWSMAMAIRPSHALLVAAVVGNGALVLLWLTTRTTGIPGLLPEPEAVGPWDVACALWEVVVVVASVRALRAAPGPRLRVPSWNDWEPFARAWALGSALVLLALTLSGAGA